MSVEAFSSITNCGLLSVAKNSQTSSHSDGCGVALRYIKPCWAVFQWCRWWSSCDELDENFPNSTVSLQHFQFSVTQVVDTFPVDSIDCCVSWWYTVRHHLTCGINSLLHSVNLIVFTVLLVHLNLCIGLSPHHSHHLRFTICHSLDLSLQT